MKQLVIIGIVVLLSACGASPKSKPVNPYTPFPTVTPYDPLNGATSSRWEQVTATQSYGQLPEITIQAAISLAISPNQPKVTFPLAPVAAQSSVRVLGSDQSVGALLILYQNRLGWIPTFSAGTGVSALDLPMLPVPTDFACPEFLFVTSEPQTQWSSPISGDMLLHGLVYRPQSGTSANAAVPPTISIAGAGQVDPPVDHLTALAGSGEFLMFTAAVNGLDQGSELTFAWNGLAEEPLVVQIALLRNDCPEVTAWNRGHEAIAAGDWDTARKAFREIQGYQNADELWKESTYQWIRDAMENGNWRIATDLILELQEVDRTYQDIATLTEHYGIVGELGRRQAHVWLDGNIQQIGEFQAHAGAASSVVFSPNAQVLVSGGEDGDIHFWRAADGTLLHTLSDHSGTVHGVAFSANGQFLVSGSADGTIKIWEVSGMQVNLIKTLTHGGAVHSVAFSPDGTLLASGGRDGTLKIWEVSGTQVSQIKTLTHGSVVRSVAFTPNGEWLIFGGGMSIGILRLSDGKLHEQKDEGLFRSVQTIAVNPNNQDFVWASHQFSFFGTPNSIISRLITPEGNVRAYRIDKGDGANGLDFSPDGRTLAWGGSYEGVVLYQYTEGQGHQIKPLTIQSSDHAVCLDFSPDGRTLASGSGSGVVRLWRAEE